MKYQHNDDEIDGVLDRYSLGNCDYRQFGTGLINSTFLIKTKEDNEYILQKINPVFLFFIHQNIDVVTHHLLKKGLVSPVLIRTSSEELFVQTNTARWRLMSYIDGESRDTITSLAMATEAGRLLGRFHLALGDLQHNFSADELHLFDLDYHLQRLEDTIQHHTTHCRFSHIAPLAGRIIEIAGILRPCPKLPERVVHGDLKISNVLFTKDTAEAICLVDLDTLGKMQLPMELGDAMRSWCNPSGESDLNIKFDPGIFFAAMSGYASSAGNFIGDLERSWLVESTLRISIILAARFCVDALREDYFSWDDRQFTSHSEHSQRRALNQLTLAKSIDDQKSHLEQLVTRAFSKENVLPDGGRREDH